MDWRWSSADAAVARLLPLHRRTALCGGNLSGLLYTFDEMNIRPNRLVVLKEDEHWARRVAAAIWPRLVELWLGTVIIFFFLIRILESQTARRLLDSLEHHRLP